MLKQLKLSNFRIFDDEVTIRFRPITVLIGKNNAGKSSIIKFLLMLQQSIGLNSKAFLDSRGEKVKLGKFYELKNRKSRKRYLNFTLAVQEDDSPGDALSVYLNSRHINPYEHSSQYMCAANVLYNRLNIFQGRDWRLVLLSNEKKMLQRSVAITENSSFLELEDEHQRQLEDSDIETNKKIRAEQYCLKSIAQKISSIVHIAPGREDTLRTFDTGEDIPINQVGRSGEYVLHHLWRLYNEYENQFEFICSHLEKILDIKDITFLEKGDLAQCEVVNSKTGARTNIANFSFGTSQCLPILVQGTMMHRNATLMIEQPETQLHPTAQLELGSFFANLWRERNVSSIIETHSGNILLRLRKLVAEKEMEADDVSIAFFDIVDGKAVIKNLNINQDGSMEDGLPMEFFGADIIEGLELGAAKFKQQSGEDHEQLGQ